jgi:tRNA(fMet)-specific endonuclease VapC
MVDTNTVSYILKGNSHTARTRLAGLQQSEIACISAITEAELRYGLAKSSRASILGPAIEGFLTRIQVLPWGRDETQAYGILRAKQEAAGKTLGNLDLLIAAHAISVKATFVTNDKAFSQVPGIQAIVNWATDL